MPPDLLNASAPAPNATSDMPQVTETPTQTPASVPTPTEPPGTPPAPTEAPAKPREPIAARISEIAGQRREAEARAARLEAVVSQQSEQLREALVAIGKLTTATASTTPVISDTSGFSDPRPVRETYGEPEAYETALVTWAGQKAAAEASAAMLKQQEERDREREERSAQSEREREADAARKRQEEDNTRLTSAWNERRAKAIEKYEDYIEVAEDTNLPVSVAMAHTLLNSDNGAEILYYLGKHPEEAARISGLIVPGQVFPPGTGALSGAPVPDGVAQAFELGKIATKLGIDETPAVTPGEIPNTLANAAIQNGAATTSTVAVVAPTVLPTPPVPISGASASATVRDPNAMSMEEYAAMRGPQIRAQRSPGRSQLQ